MEPTSLNISKNIRQLRRSRGLSQDQLASASGIPRPTWSNLESGSANPTISLILKVAATLQVSIEEIVGTPREVCRLYPAASLPKQRRGEAAIRKLLPEGIPGVEFDRIELPHGARMAGVPHRSGTREYLTCESGTIELSVAGEKYQLQPGDVIVFRGDQKHSYSNTHRDVAVGFSVVLLAPGSI